MLVNRYYCRPIKFDAIIARVASSSSSSSSSSPFTPYKPQKQTNDDTPSLYANFRARIKNYVTGKKKGSIVRQSPAPLNYSYPNKKGVYGYEATTSLEEFKDEFGDYAKRNIRLAKEEFKQRITESVDDPYALDETLGPLQNQVNIDFDFKSKNSLDRWQIGYDSLWGQGFSKASLELTEHNTALFSGHIDTRVLRDGKIERAGWAGIKSVDYLAFNRKFYKIHWDYYSHILVKCRGDGRSYKLMLHTPSHLDLTWLDSSSYPLHTHGGPYWQYERIPFSRFFITVGGRIQDMQRPVPNFFVSNIGIVLMDRVDGPFNLEIEFIGVVNDRMHEERFAYEQYSLPIYTTIGM